VLRRRIVIGLAARAELQAVERATGGWGLSLHFFRVPWIMDGPWYQTWLTSFVLLVLFFLYGMWYGLVFRRWSMPGLVAFIARPGAGDTRCRRGGVDDRQLARRRALLRHADGTGADRRAGRARRCAGTRRVHQHSPGHRLTAGSRAGGQAAGSTMTFRPVRAAAAAIASGAPARPKRPVTSEASSTWPPVASLIARG
jgi:hypothetical protein